MSKASNIFKPTVSQIKGEATTRAALAIIDADRAAQAAKTERLRAARLALEAEGRTQDAIPAKQPPKAKTSASVARKPKTVRAKAVQAKTDVEKSLAAE